MKKILILVLSIFVSVFSVSAYGFYDAVSNEMMFSESLEPGEEVRTLKSLGVSDKDAAQLTEEIRSRWCSDFVGVDMTPDNQLGKDIFSFVLKNGPVLMRRKGHGLFGTDTYQIYIINTYAKAWEAPLLRLDIGGNSALVRDIKKAGNNLANLSKDFIRGSTEFFRDLF